MQDDKINSDDVSRLFLGETPVWFLLEVAFRTVLIYLALILVVRLLGKRMNGQLSIAEMAVMITLGAIISAPMQMPDRGILQGVLILSCVLGSQRLINYYGAKSKVAEQIIYGNPTLIVKDGILQIGVMADENISHQQLYAALRNNGFLSLGEIQRVYLEGNGKFSIYPFRESVPGLSLMPGKDIDIQCRL